MHFDVFNGDADGILSLLQLRLANPKHSTLVTGVKRDILLLEKIEVSQGDTMTVLDISMERNKQALLSTLEHVEGVFYADHHQAGDIPESEKLEAHIDLDANTCTALIVDRYLHGKFHLWAITAAYGDNLNSVADALVLKAGLTPQQGEQLNELGILVNYNGYGEHVDDLHYHPAALFKLLLKYPSPFDVIDDVNSPFYTLKRGYEADLDAVSNLKPVYQSHTLCVIELPDNPCSRRISGVYGNRLANETTYRAHVILTRNANQTLRVSLRAPLDNKQGAGEICRRFDTGGGRAAAAGINSLPEDKLDYFIHAVEQFYSR